MPVVINPQCGVEDPGPRFLGLLGTQVASVRAGRLIGDTSHIVNI